MYFFLLVPMKRLKAQNMKYKIFTMQREFTLQKK